METKQGIKETSNLTRQQKRRQQQEEFKKNENLRKMFSQPVTKGELYGLVENFKKLSDRLYQLDIFSSALESLLIEKRIFTRYDIETSFKAEVERSITFKEINSQTGDYEKRLSKCKEFSIDPNTTVIPRQIMEDATLTQDVKDDYFKVFKLEDLDKKEKIEEENV